MAKPDSERRRIERRFLEGVLAARLIEPGSVILAGLSGGPDSTALLLLLAQSQEQLRCRVEAAYFDHRIRSLPEREAELDAVRHTARLLDVPLHIGAASVPALAGKQKRSLEDQARVERYGFFAETAASRSAKFVATGHTANDQVETILLHLIRGAGLRGLAGIKPRSSWPFGSGPTLIRPLLGLVHGEAEAYCRTRGVEFFHDSENDSLKYLRNRIRSELLPVLKSMNSGVEDALLRLGQAAAETEELLQSLVRQSVAVKREDGVVIPMAALQAMPPALQAEVISSAFEQAAGSRQGLEQTHIEALRLLGTGSTLDLPRGILCQCADGELRLLKHEERRRGPADRPFEFALDVPGLVRRGGYEIRSRLVAKGEVCCPTASRAVLAFSELKVPLVVRSWRPGDRVRPVGMIGRKKLQDLFVDAKVPHDRRRRIPLLVVGDEVLWVPGLTADLRAAVHDQSIERIAVEARSLTSEQRDE
jgi:tRNA(Ile)-lysidine synthase